MSMNSVCKKNPRDSILGSSCPGRPFGPAPCLHPSLTRAQGGGKGAEPARGRTSCESYQTTMHRRAMLLLLADSAPSSARLRTLPANGAAAVQSARIAPAPGDAMEEVEATDAPPSQIAALQLPRQDRSLSCPSSPLRTSALAEGKFLQRQLLDGQWERLRWELRADVDEAWQCVADFGGYVDRIKTVRTAVGYTPEPDSLFGELRRMVLLRLPRQPDSAAARRALHGERCGAVCDVGARPAELGALRVDGLLARAASADAARLCARLVLRRRAAASARAWLRGRARLAARATQGVLLGTRRAWQRPRR